MARFYLTTAIDYVNNRPHLGTAYEKIAADVIARYKRLAGVDVRFVMGNDEHSQNVFRKAHASWASSRWPTAIGWRTSSATVWSRLNISFDDFIRTTEPRHKARGRGARAALVRRRRHLRGRVRGLVLRLVRGVQAGEGPRRRAVSDPPDEAGLDQGEELLLPAVGVPRPRCSRTTTRIPTFVEPESRRNEMLRLLEGGLEDISVSRAGQSWGIPLPFDPTSVVYVWYDALINYAAAVGYGSDEALFDTWWPADLHLVGKDITRFHCVVWPAMLMSAGLALPRQVFGHGWVLFKGEKMSKSLGTVRRSARGGGPARPGSAAAVSDARDRLRSGRRLLVGAVREVVQRRPGEQPRQPRQPRDVDGAAVSRRACCTGPASRAETARRRRRGRAGRIARGDGPARAVERRRDACMSVSSTRPTSYIATREPWKLAKAGDDARARRRAVGRERGAADRGRPARAVHAGVVRRDPAPARRGPRRPRRCVSTATPRGRPTAHAHRSAGHAALAAARSAPADADRQRFDQGDAV